MKRMLVGLLFLTVAANAFAYYMPGQGRWLNQDPIGEAGFESLRRATFKNRGRIGGQLAEIARGPNLYVLIMNAPVNRIDRLGLEIFPNGVPPPGQSPCEKAMSDAEAMFGNISNDARAHCIASCTIAKACGERVCRCLGTLKEARDLSIGGVEWACSWLLPKKAENWLHDHLQGGSIDDSAQDFFANDYGLDVAAEGRDCVSECEKKFGGEPLQ